MAIVLVEDANKADEAIVEAVDREKAQRYSIASMQISCGGDGSKGTSL